MNLKVIYTGCLLLPLVSLTVVSHAHAGNWIVKKAKKIGGDISEGAKDLGGDISDAGKHVGSVTDKYLDSLVNKTKSGIKGSAQKGPRMPTRMVMVGEAKIADHTGWYDRYSNANPKVFFICDSADNLDAAFRGASNWEWIPISRGDFCRLATQHFADKMNNGWERSRLNFDCNTTMTTSGSEAFQCWHTKANYDQAFAAADSEYQQQAADLIARKAELEQVKSKQIDALDYQLNVASKEMTAEQKRAADGEATYNRIQQDLLAKTKQLQSLHEQFDALQNKITAASNDLQEALAVDARRLSTFKADVYAVYADLILAADMRQLADVRQQKQELAQGHTYFCQQATSSALKLNALQQLSESQTLVIDALAAIEQQTSMRPEPAYTSYTDNLRALKTSLQQALVANQNAIAGSLWLHEEPKVCLAYDELDPTLEQRESVLELAMTADAYKELSSLISSALLDHDYQMRAIEFKSNFNKVLRELWSDYTNYKIKGYVAEVLELNSSASTIIDALLRQLQAQPAQLVKYLDLPALNKLSEGVRTNLSNANDVSLYQVSRMLNAHSANLSERINQLVRPNNCPGKDADLLLTGAVYNHLPITRGLSNIIIDAPNIRSLDDALDYDAILKKSDESLTLIENLCAGKE